MLFAGMLDDLGGHAPHGLGDKRGKNIKILMHPVLDRPATIDCEDDPVITGLAKYSHRLMSFGSCYRGNLPFDGGRQPLHDLFRSDAAFEITSGKIALKRDIILRLRLATGDRFDKNRGPLVFEIKVGRRRFAAL